MNSDHIQAILLLVPFLVWNLYRDWLLKTLTREGVKTQALVRQKLLNTIQYEYKAEDGKAYLKQLRLPRSLAREAQKGSHVDVLYYARLPGLSCIAEAVPATLRRNRRMMWLTLFLMGFFALNLALSSLYPELEQAPPVAEETPSAPMP